MASLLNLDFPSPTALDSASALFDDASTEWMDYGTLRARIKETVPYYQFPQRGLIFCCIPRTIDGVVAYMGAAASGNAVAIIDPEIQNLTNIVAAYQPEWITAPAGRDFPGYRKAKVMLGTLVFWKREAQGATAIHRDLYLLLLTSGTTGGQKAVRLSHMNIASNTAAIIESLDLASDTRALLHLPLSYAFGLSILHTQLAVGGSVVLTEFGIMTPAFWKMAKEQQATLLPGVPYHYEIMARLGLDHAPTFKTFLQAGGGMKTELATEMLQKIRARNAQFYIMYGQTEAAPRISILPLHDVPEKLGSCGRVLSGGGVEIEDGEIIYHGPNVMMGYAENRADLARGDDMEGRLPTGDLGHFDGDGYLYVTGRSQRFAKLHGHRIALDELEKIVSSIASTVAIELPDRILLVAAGQGAAICEDIKARAVNETGLPPGWFEVRSVETIPYKTNGKVDYSALQEGL